MTPAEKEMFHKNYRYMWQKLNTTHYFVKGPSAYSHFSTSDSPSSAMVEYAKARIKGVDLLPSYAVCSRCNSNEDYEPTDRIVMKIVAFYNQNIMPEVSVNEFLHKDLSLTDEYRQTKGTVLDERFSGIYYGYYISDSNSVDILGSVLKIYKEDGILKAAIVTGIRSDSELLGDSINELFQGDSISKKDFDSYYSSKSIDDMRCYYYEGIVEITGDSVFILFRGSDEEERKLVFTLNTKSFPARLKRDYIGGLAFTLSASDGPFDTRFCQMCLIRSDIGSFSLNDSRVAKFLKIRTSGKDVWLTSRLDRAWFELAMQPHNEI